MYNVSLNKNNIKSKLGARHLIYFVAFLFTLHLTPSVYVISNFITKFIDESKVGFIYSIGSLLTISAFVVLRSILIKYGNFKTFIATLFIEIFVLSILLIPNLDPRIAISAIIVSLLVQATSYLHLDIFISHYSTIKDTGTVRGAFLTSQNIAYVIGPLLAGLMLRDQEFWKVFLFGITMLIPTIILSLKYLKNFKDPIYRKTEFVITGIKILKNKDLYNVVAVNGLLKIFYTWMVIYAPIFLTIHIGFTLGETASIIGMALIAFLIFTNPLGYISDKILGEKEILIAGFGIISIATMTISFVDIKNFWLWVLILFMTRVGASMIEIMSETYFFKKIDEEDLNMISFFRTLRPIISLFFPVLASGLLIFIDIKYLFLILGIFMLYGIKYSLAIKDTL